MIQETPSALALIICDQIITDERTKKKTLVGIFNTITVAKLPKSVPTIFAFVSVRGGKGKYQATLKVSHQDTDDALVQLSGTIEFDDPFHVVEISFNLRNLRFAEAGAHCFEFYCNDVLVCSRPFNIRLKDS